MSKLKDKKLSLPSGSSAVTGGRKPLVRHNSVNLPVNRRLNTPTKGTVSDSGVGLPVWGVELHLQTRPKLHPHIAIPRRGGRYWR